jgi:hypothetical protein
MENPIDQVNRIQPDFEFNDLIDFSNGDEYPLSSIFRDASSEGTAMRAGVQSSSLKLAMDSYAREMDRSAITKAGLPAKTPSQQYKGFIAERTYTRNYSPFNYC